MNSLVSYVAVTSSQQQPLIVGLDMFSTIVNILVLILSLIISVSASMITFTWKAAQLKAKFDIKDLVAKNSIVELQRDAIALSKQLEDDNRELRRKIGNLEAKTRSIENHLVKHMSFIPKDTREIEN